MTSETGLWQFDASGPFFVDVRYRKLDQFPIPGRIPVGFSRHERFFRQNLNRP